MAFTASPPEFVPSSLGWHPSPARRKLAAAVAAVATLGVGGYGASQLSRDGGTSTTVASLQVNLPLSARVLEPSVLPRFVVTRNPLPISNPSAWATVERSPSPLSEGARLGALGFVGGVAEQLHGQYPVNAQAISIVEQFRTSSGARRELAYQFAQLKNQHGDRLSTFSVPGIPGARGVRITGGATAGANVLFAAGSYYYAVGAGSPSSSHGALGQGRLSAAAGWLYLASRGCVSNVTRSA
jgi:hypothetical protein